jgi:hypothetical protein
MQYYNNEGWIGEGAGSQSATGYKPDIFNQTSSTYAEIKPYSNPGIADAETAMDNYSDAFTSANKFAPDGFQPDGTWNPPYSVNVLDPESGQMVEIYLYNEDGVIFYTDSVEQAYDWQLAGADGAETIEDFTEEAPPSIGEAFDAAEELPEFIEGFDTCELSVSLATADIDGMMGAP